MEIRGIHGGRVEGSNAHHSTSNISKKLDGSQKASGSEAGDAHVRSPELLRLSEELHRIPEVREEVVARVAEKLAQGDYDTRDAAIKTAESILNQS